MRNSTRIIGITGNIATGKSVVRSMLANLGVLCMDADVIAHRVIYPSGEAYPGVIAAFGEEILEPDRAISRQRLGQVVFQNPKKLGQLETLVHPAVTHAVKTRLDRTHAPLAAVEAIKLLESDLVELCDEVWVTDTPEDIQLARLVGARGLSEDDAQTRMDAQPPQEAKIAQADMVITTVGTFKETWDQICSALNDTIQLTTIRDVPRLLQLESLARLEARWGICVGQDGSSLYEVLGRQMVLPLPLKEPPDGLALWENRAFTAALVQVLPPPSGDLLGAFQTQAEQQASEILMFRNGLDAQLDLHPASSGFYLLNPADLDYPDWRREAERTLPGFESTLWVKSLQEPVERLR